MIMNMNMMNDIRRQQGIASRAMEAAKMVNFEIIKFQFINIF